MSCGKETDKTVKCLLEQGANVVVQQMSDSLSDDELFQVLRQVSDEVQRRLSSKTTADVSRLFNQFKDLDELDKYIQDVVESKHQRLLRALQDDLEEQNEYHYTDAKGTLLIRSEKLSAQTMLKLRKFYDISLESIAKIKSKDGLTIPITNKDLKESFIPFLKSLDEIQIDIQWEEPPSEIEDTFEESKVVVLPPNMPPQEPIYVMPFA